MNEVLGITNDFFHLSNSKILKGSEPRYNENFVRANIFYPSHGPSLYRGSAVKRDARAKLLFCLLNEFLFYVFVAVRVVGS